MQTTLHMGPALWSISLADAHKLRGSSLRLPYPLTTFEAVSTFGLLVGPIKLRRIWRDGGRNCAAMLGEGPDGRGMGASMRGDMEEDPVRQALIPSTLTTTGVLACETDMGGCRRTDEITSWAAVEALVHGTQLRSHDGSSMPDAVVVWVIGAGTGRAASNVSVELTEHLVSTRVAWSRSLRASLEQQLESQWSGDGGWGASRVKYRECERWRVGYSVPRDTVMFPVQDVLLDFDMNKAQTDAETVSSSIAGRRGDEVNDTATAWSAPTVTAVGKEGVDPVVTDGGRVDLGELVHQVLSNRETRAKAMYKTCTDRLSGSRTATVSGPPLTTHGSVEELWDAYGAHAWCRREAEYELLSSSDFGVVLDGGSDEGASLSASLGERLEEHCARHLLDVQSGTAEAGSEAIYHGVRLPGVLLRYPAPYLSCLGGYIDHVTNLRV